VPNPDVVSYFRSLELEHTVHAKGIEYAWIYKGPQFILSEMPAPQYPAQADPSGLRPSGRSLAGKALFLGYDSYGPVESDVKSGDTLHITTYWRCLEEMAEDYSVYVRLEDEAGHLWGQTDAWPAKGFLLTSQWKEGMIIKDEVGHENRENEWQFYCRSSINSL
jgi:hypothetical protein